MKTMWFARSLAAGCLLTVQSLADEPLPPPEPAPLAPAAEANSPPALPAPAAQAPTVAPVPAPEPAQQPAQPIVDKASSRVVGSPSRYRLGVAIRAGSIADRGFDQIADGSGMPGIGFEATGVFYRYKRISVATGLGWDFGGRQGDVRDLQTKLSLHHILVPLEARVSILPWLDVRGRVSPGASFFSVDFGAGSTATTATGWAFSTEAAVGVSARLLGNREEARTFEMWGLIDGGYLLSTSTTIEASRRPPEEQLGVQGASNYGTLSPRGGFLRFGLAMAF